MTKWIVLSFSLLFSFSMAASAGEPTYQGQPEYTFYKIIETAPGTRSQSWQGTYYKAGKAVPLAAGQVVEYVGNPAMRTGIFHFVGVPCTAPGKPCGAILDTMRKAPNIIMKGNWSYRLFGVALYRCGGLDVFSELTRDGVVLTAKDAVNSEIATPMGVFRFKKSGKDIRAPTKAIGFSNSAGVSLGGCGGPAAGWVPGQ